MACSFNARLQHDLHFEPLIDMQHNVYLQPLFDLSWFSDFLDLFKFKNDRSNTKASDEKQQHKYFYFPPLPLDSDKKDNNTFIM